jgi:hypothetical protein
MHRREFITILAGGERPHGRSAGAQQAGRVPRVGYIASYAEDDAQGRQFRRAFRDALEKLGSVDGRNIHIDYRAFQVGRRIATSTWRSELFVAIHIRERPIAFDTIYLK